MTDKDGFGGVMMVVLRLVYWVRGHLRESEDMKLYRSLIVVQRRSPATLEWEVEPGTREHSAAERLVSKGWLQRSARRTAYQIA